MPFMSGSLSSSFLKRTAAITTLALATAGAALGQVTQPEADELPTDEVPAATAANAVAASVTKTGPLALAIVDKNSNMMCFERVDQGKGFACSEFRENALTGEVKMMNIVDDGKLIAQQFIDVESQTVCFANAPATRLWCYGLNEGVDLESHDIDPSIPALNILGGNTHRIIHRGLGLAIYTNQNDISGAPFSESTANTRNDITTLNFTKSNMIRTKDYSTGVICYADNIYFSCSALIERELPKNGGDAAYRYNIISSDPNDKDTTEAGAKYIVMDTEVLNYVSANTSGVNAAELAQYKDTGGRINVTKVKGAHNTDKEYYKISDNYGSVTCYKSDSGMGCGNYEPTFVTTVIEGLKQAEADKDKAKRAQQPDLKVVFTCAQIVDNIPYMANIVQKQIGAAEPTVSLVTIVGPEPWTTKEYPVDSSNIKNAEEVAKGFCQTGTPPTSLAKLDHH